MSEDYKNNQIIRKDAKNCFVESLNDSFSIGKAHLGFASYDMNKPAGSRQTNRINIYISVEELLELCRKLSCGELKYMFQNKKKASDSSPLYQCLGGTSAERLKEMGKSRNDGMSLSRTAQIICGSKCDILFVADSGPGEENEKGLIVPRFGNKPENHVAVSMTFDSLMAGFGFLTKYIYDDEVEEINCNGWNDIEIITSNGWSKIDEHFLTPLQCIDMTKKMCQLGGVIIDGSQPTQDSFITQGVRISAIIPPCIDEAVGAVFSIRKQKNNVITKQQLIDWDTATEEELDLLTLCISHGVSIGIAGSTGSGKTTDIGFILRSIPYDKRIYSIEDSRELNLQVKDENGKILNRVIHTKTRPSQNTAQNVSADVLLKKSLRFDPQIIVPAEMRGEEAMTAQEAGRTGHTIITSLHASTALAAYTRILTMCMMSGTKLSEELMLKLIIEAYPIMAFKMQLPDKSRKYMKIIEAEDYRDGGIIYRTLYKYVITDRIMNKDGTQIDKMVGYHKKVSNISSRLANILLENGADLQTIHRFAGENWSPEADTEG